MSSLSFPRPLASVDVVILTIRNEALHVLLVRRSNQSEEPFPDQWALPGGFIDTRQDSDLEGCARRKLKEKTGVDSPYLEQVGSWGSTDRDPRDWSITHVYVALLSNETLELQKGGNTADLSWFPVTNDGVETSLAFDHATLLKAALERIRGKTEYTSIPVYLLPETFTLSELQRVYEIVLGRPLEKKAFRTRMLAAPLLETVEGMKQTGRRPAQLYRLSQKSGLNYFARTFVLP